MSEKKVIPLFKVFMSDSAVDEAAKVLRSGFIGQGPKVEEFEKYARQHFNHDYIFTCNSGTSTLHLMLHLLKKPNGDWPGLKDGDEVLATPLTCTASNWPILANNLNIKWVDIDPENLNMDLDDLCRKITAKTKVILLVHWGGYPVDLDKVKEIQKKVKEIHGFAPAVIEDGAHAFGSKYKGRPIGTHGNLTMFSLQAIKHVTSVDGGLFFSPHKEIFNRGKLLRWYGIDRESDRKDFRCEADIEEWGFKFHMNDVCAAVGLENLKNSEALINKHKQNAKYYDDKLKDIPGVTLLKRNSDMDSAFWIYSLLVEDREGFNRHMKKKGIMVSQVHERNDKHTCVEKFRAVLPNVDKTVPKLTAIPVGWWITEADREYIVESIKEGW
jgi:dTDP-4-amino-4,6-dideoxygalactose transaminase